MRLDISDNLLLVMLLALIIVATFLFKGDPDIVDALIKYLTDSSK